MKNKTKLKIKKSWTRKKIVLIVVVVKKEKRKKSRNKKKKQKKNIRKSTNQYLGWWWSKSWETIKKHVSKTACFLSIHSYLKIHQNSCVKIQRSRLGIRKSNVWLKKLGQSAVVFNTLARLICTLIFLGCCLKFFRVASAGFYFRVAA